MKQGLRGGGGADRTPAAPPACGNPPPGTGPEGRPRWWRPGRSPASGRRAWRTVLGLALALLLICGASFAALDALFPFPWERLAPPASTVVLGNRGEPIRFFLARDQAWRFPVALDEVSPICLDTLLASEDRYFFSHPGVNPLSILQAALGNIQAGRVVRGGSTITMQVARLAEPKPRSYWAKAVECFRALQLELRLSKREILNHYVNLVPCGGNIVGLGAASWFYFGKTPDKLSLAESALLAAIPRAPGRYNPVKRPEAAQAARDRVLAAALAVGAATAEEVEHASAQGLPERLRRPPLVGPHLAQMAAPGRDRPARVRTTLDSRVQELARQAMRSRLVELRAQGVENASVVVLDLANREVLALAGSADFFDDAHHGKVNAATAPRSPGSALKPFLYALAFEKGLIAPESLLLDIPIATGTYDPRNYDGSYRGRVEAQEALIHSLNAPAVRLLADVGAEPFHRLLVDGGLRTLTRPTAHYGLSLVLGGGEVSLLDLTNLYATLARGGMHGPPSILADGRSPREARLLGPEACALVTGIISRLERPDLAAGVEKARGVPAVAWKTGTSFGHRDAFALGFSARLAVGVWVGNVDGRPVKGISGARQAAPLLFDVFRALEPDGMGLPRTEGLNLAEAEVCALSRQLPGPDCDKRVRMSVIPGVTRLEPCPVHRRVLVDAATGLRVTGECLTGREVRQELVTQFPAELTAWWRSGGMPAPGLPEPSPDCPEAMAGLGPRITSPKARMVYQIRPDSPSGFQRVGLCAQAGADAGALTWFQDGAHVAASQVGETVFLELTPGAHRLVVVDAQGRSDALRYEVQ